jgi:transposase
VRAASSDKAKGLWKEAHDLKEALAEQMLENKLLKKSALADGEYTE